MVKILFYGFVVPEYDKRFYLSTAGLVLKTFFDDTHELYKNDVEWHFHQEKLSDSGLINLCNEIQPDFLCTSNYIWNHDHICRQLESVRSKLPENTLVISGGPSINVNIDDDFFTKYPFIDYAVYGPGEYAISDLIIHRINNKKLLAMNTSNIGWWDREKNTKVVAEYKYVPISNSSYYLHNQEVFSSMVKEAQSKGYEPAVPFEMTRGCPYKCTFCDWNSGLSNKVSRKKSGYKDTIDLIHNLGIKYIYLADANVGQYDEDIEIIEYFADKNLNHNAGFILDGNMSKLKKDNNLKIFKLFAKAKLVKPNGLVFSVQDTNREVLNNIDRPDVSWEKHLELLHILNTEYPDILTKVQLIQGLPGQTVATWKSTLEDVCRELALPQVFVSEMLAASPAARDPEYQKKFKFVYSNAQRIHIRKSENQFYRGQIPESCISFTKHDFAEMTILSHLYTGLQMFKAHLFRNSYGDIDTIYLANKVIETQLYTDLIEHLCDQWNNDKFYINQIYDFDFHLAAKAPKSACEIVEQVFVGYRDYWKTLIKYLDNHEAKKLATKIIVGQTEDHWKILEIGQDYY
jgi:tRNA A37 methylthiotransferase MiaB